MRKYIIYNLVVIGFMIIAFRVSSYENAIQLYSDKAYRAIELNRFDSISFNLDEDIVYINVADDTISFDYYENPEIVIGRTLPLVEITTDEYCVEIPNKVDYKSGMLSIRGFGEYEDIEKDVNIRGRGNTSWNFAKKPYRLKFSKKVSLCNLISAKNYVLLASYTDPSFIQFALAIKIADMLGLEYTNHVVPVEVVLNGIYKGIYFLTNKPGINAGSVDIDEDNSVMWELDSYFDEDLKFRSPIYGLPVNLSDPEMDEETFEKWKDDFIEMEKSVYLGNCGDYVDLDVLAKFMLVYDILRNEEIVHPKSVKMYKEGDGKYIFGPIWDFDFAMGATWGDLSSSYDLNQTKGYSGRHSFFTKIEKDPSYEESRKDHWTFMSDKLPELLEVIDGYANLVRLAIQRNDERWGALEDYDSVIFKMKEWLTKRYEWLIENMPTN